MIRSYGELSRGDISDGRLAGCVAVVPVGAMECHGPHLPLATDTMIAEAIVDRAASELDGQDAPTALRLPGLWLGVSPEHELEPGTLTHDQEGLLDTVGAIAGGLSRQGVRRIIFLNAHGGNVATLGVAALAARRDHAMLAANVHWMDFGLPPELDPPGEIRGDVHGGWIETSIMLVARPELVQMEKACGASKAPPATSLFPKGAIKWGWMARDLGENGVIGHPEVASAAIGAALLNHAGVGLAGLIRDLAGAAWSPDA